MKKGLLIFALLCMIALMNDVIRLVNAYRRPYSFPKVSDCSPSSAILAPDNWLVFECEDGRKGAIQLESFNLVQLTYNLVFYDGDFSISDTFSGSAFFLSFANILPLIIRDKTIIYDPVTGEAFFNWSPPNTLNFVSKRIRRVRVISGKITAEAFLSSNVQWKNVEVNLY